MSISITAAIAEGDMVIRGETMRHDSKESIATAEGGAGLATADWGSNQTLKKLQAKTIRAKISQHNPSVNQDASIGNVDDKQKTSQDSVSNSLGQDVEWLEAKDCVQVTFPNRTMTADYCKSQGKKINCTGNVTIISGRNHVKGDKGSFDLEKDQYEISTNQSTKQQVEATLYSTKNQVESMPEPAVVGA
jgi:hypothetical protein